ncbi:hypothetical protein D3C81_1976220 [compost metagenome]
MVSSMLSLGHILTAIRFAKNFFDDSRFSRVAGLFIRDFESGPGIGLVVAVRVWAAPFKVLRPISH